MSKPYWIEYADRPAITLADLKADLDRSERVLDDLTWEPQGRPPAPAFRIEVTFIGVTGER